MDTINIINNVDEKIIKTNLLLLNQKKLTELVIDIFEKDFADIDDNILTVEYVAEYMNKQNFINWELFLTLLNLKTTIQFEIYSSFITKDERTCNSLMYIFYYFIIEKENKNNKLIKFLLKLPTELICWNVYSKPYNSSILNILFDKNFIKLDNEIIELLINNSSFNNLWTHTNNIYNYCPLGHLLLYKKNIHQTIKLFTQKIIDLNEKIMWKNNMCPPILFFIYNENIEAIQNLIDLKVNLNDNQIYLQLGTCNNIEIFKMLENNGFDLIKKNDDNELIFKIFNIESIEIMKYFIDKGYVELYDQILLNSIKNNYEIIVDKFIKENLLDLKQLSNINPELIFRYPYLKILMNLFYNTFSNMYLNIYNGMEYYYVKEKELLYDEEYSNVEVNDKDKNIKND